MITLRGYAVSDGIALGKALVLKEELKVPDYPIRTADVRLELLKFDAALAASRDQLVDLKSRHDEDEDTEKILASQLMLLVDPMFVGEVIKRVRTQKRNVERIIQTVVTEFAERFQAMDNDYMRDRALDIRDVGTRILRNVLGIEPLSLGRLVEDTILVCTQLTASDVARLDSDRVVGLASEAGGATSHAAILAKSRGIPALVGLQDLTEHVKTGDQLILDGVHATMVVNPGEEEMALARQSRESLLDSWREFLAASAEEAVTTDGVELGFLANISVPAEVEQVARYGATGVGLFRTEYLFMKRSDPPSEEEQVEAYREVARSAGAGGAVIRTLDIGGDKEVDYLGIPPEKNPFLGWRSIRYCLATPDVFRTQLRALLRASVEGPIKLMYPLIASMDELDRANALLAETRAELDAAGTPYDPDMPVGMMVEVPSVAVMAERFARKVDFFSVGSNDLVQFTLAVDRTNPRLLENFEPFSPAILHLLRGVVDAARKAGIPVSCCGELASKPMGLVLLAGLGMTEFSMDAVSIPRLKRLARLVSVGRCRELVEQASAFDRASELKRAFSAYLAELGQVSPS